MIINHEKKFIFVHVFRTGGSSIDQAFRQWALPASQTHTALETIPDWNEYFSFGVVRNPWDRTVSGYHFQIKKGSFKGTFEEYVDRFRSPPLNTSKQHAQYNMLQNCSYVLRFEHLREDFQEVCGLIGVPTPTLPHVWKTNHKPYQKYFTEEMMDVMFDASRGDIEEYGFTFNGTATKNIGDRRESLRNNTTGA